MSSSAEQDAHKSGRQKLGRYEIMAEIASGGMGSVYLARLEGIGGFQRLFAIKVPHKHLASETQFVEMMLDEARLAAQIHHPNVVSIVDVAEAELGYYLVMEYVDGFTLGDVISLKELEGRERVRLCLRILMDAATGLHAAHTLKNPEDDTPLHIVHRDVSPQNVLVGLDGVGRITDFGVARAAARITSSRPGIIKGKPCYMAPEQARGQELDARADVFALGIVMWEVLTKARLFYNEVSDAVVLARVVSEEISPPSTRFSEIPEIFDDICMKALDRDVTARYQDARELVADLERAAMTSGWIATPHEVGEAMKTLFEAKIKNRRASIQQVTGVSTPALGSDVFDVPKLGRGVDERYTDALLNSDPPGSDPGPTRATRGSGPARASSSDGDISREPGSSPTLQTLQTLATQQQRSNRMMLGILVALGVGALALIGYLFSKPGPEVQPVVPPPAAPITQTVAPAAPPTATPTTVPTPKPGAVATPEQPQPSPAPKARPTPAARAPRVKTSDVKKAPQPAAPADDKPKKVYEKNPYLAE